jgi:hypothetical protein
MKIHLLVAVFVSFIQSTIAYSASAQSLQSILSTHIAHIALLKDISSKFSDDEAVAPTDDIFYLRYILSDSYQDDKERVAALKSSLKWRGGEGHAIVSSARKAVKLAMEGGGWNNGPVQKAAPNSNLIHEYLTPIQCITTSLPSTKDLVYCIRAGKIDDNGLMSTVTVDQMIEFFLYCKEVSSTVADIRSLETDSLIRVITCNDLAGVKLVGGSSDFRKSLSAASKMANELYPSLNGRTLMLNPPTLLKMLVALFNPLFPEAVRKRIRFVSGPLKDVEDLREIADGGKGRDEFVKQVDALAYGN